MRLWLGMVCRCYYLAFVAASAGLVVLLGLCGFLDGLVGLKGAFRGFWWYLVVL